MPTPADTVVRALLAQLAAGGVRHAVIAPGSRSTPLTAALTLEDSVIRPWLHLDERSAGYFALGIARQLREPVALVCTSGTAAANFLPAVVEANLSRVPLVLLTADRPPKLRDVGAPQTIDQVNLFGTHVKYACDLEAPSEGDAARQASEAVTRAAAAVAMARSEPPGPVHLNLPFQEPLIAQDSAETPAAALELSEAARGLVPEPPADDLERIAATVRGQRGVIVAGPESVGLPAGEIAHLAESLGWPVLADPLSGLRAGRHDLAGVVDSSDVLARDDGITSALRPDVVLRFGASPTSRPLTEWLARLEGTQILIDPGARWRDPDGVAQMRMHADPAVFAAELAVAVEGASAPEAWLTAWGAADRAAREAMNDGIRCLDEPFEGRLPLELAEVLPDDATLVAGNSMPVRDIDSFLPSTARALRIVGTRGASGIDGVASTAAGAAAVAGGPVALLVGDLSFLHDLNGLWPIRRYGLSLTVLLVNNDGGGIFHFLPQRQLMSDRFEEWFGTPHGLDLRHGVELQGGRHAVLPLDGREAIREALGRPGLDVLELRTERDRNVELHQQVWSAGIEAARAVLDR